MAKVGETITAEQLRKMGGKVPEVGETISASQLQGLGGVPPSAQPSTTPQPSTLSEKAGGILGATVGGDVIGEAIGTQVAKRRFAKQDVGGPSAQERQRAEGIFKRRTGQETDFSKEAQKRELLGSETFQGPTGGQIAGDVARTALLFTPVGKGGALATRGLGALGLKRGAGVGGQAIAGGATGAAFDVAEDVAEGRDVGLGGGTAVGAGLPLVSKGIGVARSLLGRVGAEAGGALTGTSAETLEQAFDAARKGGKELETFTQALRNRTTPEQLVNSLRTNISQVATQRNTQFKDALGKITNKAVQTKTAKDSLVSQLNEAGITIGDNALLDFGKSKLKLVPSAQRKIQQAFTEVNNLPEVVRLGDLDTTRQAVKALSLTGDEPAANLGNKLIDDATRSIRQAGESVEGYGKLLDDFGETSEFLDELQRGVSSGDRATIDQTFRRLTTTLRTNNEQRMALLRELDEATDGAILSRVSGQQLSELFPRGLIRQIGTSIAVGGAAFGGIPSSVLLPLIFASPKVTGEVIRALGVTTRIGGEIMNVIRKLREVYIKAGIITGAETSE